MFFAGRAGKAGNKPPVNTQSLQIVIFAVPGGFSLVERD